MRRILKIVICLIIYLTGCSPANQDSGSLTNQSSSRLKLDGLLDQSLVQIRRGNYDSADYILIEAKKLAEESKDTLSLSSTMNNLGLVQYRLANYDLGIQFYEESLSLDRLLYDSARIGRRLKNVGLCYRQKGLHQLAVRYYREALKIAENLEVEKEIASVNNSLGSVYEALKDYEQSIEYYRVASDIWESVGDTLRRARALNNVGNAQLGLGLNDQAIVSYRSALEIKRSLKDSSEISSTLNNLGEALFESSKFAEATGSYMEALIIMRRMKDRTGIAILGNNLAALNMSQNNFKNAQKWLNTSSSIAEEIGSNSVKLENLRLQKELYAGTGNFQKAFEVDREYDEMKQTAFNEQVVQVQRLQFQYDLDQEEQAKLTAQNERDLSQARESEQRLRAEIQTYFIGLAVIAVILIGYFALSLRKKNRHIENLIKELHHRVKNHLGMISGMFGAQSGLPRADTAVLDEAKTRVEAVNGIHRRLYREDEYEFVNMHEYLTELVDSNALVFGLFNKIEKEFKINSEPMDIDKAISVGLIANEVLTNAFKYGLRETNNPVLNILLEKVTRGHRMVIFNNANPKADTSEGTGFGSELIRRLVANLKGTVHTKQEDGFHFELTFP